MDWNSPAMIPYRLRTVRIGVQTSVLTVLVLVCYRFLPGRGDANEALFTSLLALGFIGAAVVAGVPWKRMLEQHQGMWALYVWSAADILLITLGVAFTGGSTSPLFLLYGLTSVFFAASYPPRVQAVLMAATIACYLGVVAFDPSGMTPARLFVHVGEIVLITYITLLLSKELMRQMFGHLALSEENAELAEDLRRREARFRSLVQNASDVIGVIDSGGVLVYVSPGIEALLGYPPDRATGANVFTAVHDDDAGTLRARFDELMEEPGGTAHLDLRLRHSDGSIRWVEALFTNLLLEPSVSGIVVNFRDITERRAFETQLQYQAFHDALTGLPNRAHLQQRLAQAPSSDAGGRLAVLLLDLDGFKKVNDSLGHDMGDQLLIAVAERLSAQLQSGEMLARLGGDEFIILVEGPACELRAPVLAGAISRALAAGVPLGNRLLAQTASIGIAHASRSTHAVSDLLRRADLAMYAAKESGKAQYVEFDALMSEHARARLQLESELRDALRRGELYLDYQPLYSLGSSLELLGLEALVRWRHPARGLVTPTEFIPIAEETGLIVPIGKWVLEEACRQVKQWRAAVPQSSLYVSVNVSARQFAQPGFPGDVRDVLARLDLEPAALQLEITESMLMEAGNNSRASLRELQAHGVRIAIDDFGTGYSSLSYLRQYPVNVLKMDRSFVESVATEPEARALVHAITGVARTLNLQTVAEGIETDEQVQVLRSLNCDMGQGFHLGRPVSSSEITHILAAQKAA